MERKIEYVLHHKGWLCVIVSISYNEDLSFFYDSVPNKYYCGYVQVPYWHPAFEKDYGKIPVKCFGGLTYSDYTLTGVDSYGWWVGFDCAHGDYIHHPKDLDFCIKECKSIVDQLLKMED